MNDTHFVNEEYGIVSLMVTLHAGQPTECTCIVVHLDLQNGSSLGMKNENRFSHNVYTVLVN